MGRYSWALMLADPTLLLTTAVVAAAPQLVLPGPLGDLLSVAVVAAALWINHQLESSVARLPVRAGPEAMRGQTALVVEPLDPAGTVRCDGELWKAAEIRGRPLAAGARVRVTGVAGLQLQVERLD